MSSSTNNGGGIGLAGALFIVFLVLKLTGNIGWSWWWVTAPLWAPFLLVSTIIGGAWVVMTIVETSRNGSG